MNQAATATSPPPTTAAHRDALENQGKGISLDKLQHGEINLSNQSVAARGAMCNYRPDPGENRHPDWRATLHVSHQQPEQF